MVKKGTQLYYICDMENVKQGEVMKEGYEQQIKDVAEHNRKQMIKNFNEGMLYLINFSGVNKFKSIRRAIKRGHVSMYGTIYPKRPFNNRKTKDSRDKRMIYEQIKQRDI